MRCAHVLTSGHASVEYLRQRAAAPEPQLALRKQNAPDTNIEELRARATPVAGKFGIEVIQHPPDAPIPDMTKLETAFQQYDVNNTQYESQFRFKKPVYIARHDPYMLARAVMDAGRQVHPCCRRCAPCLASHRLCSTLLKKLFTHVCSMPSSLCDGSRSLKAAQP